MKIKVHWLNSPEKKFGDYFYKLLPQNIDISFGDPQNSSYEILIGGRPNKKHLETSALKSLIIPFVGVPQSTAKLLSLFPHINVHNIHFNDSATAEMAIALMLSSAKSIIPMDQQFRSNNWQGRMVNSPLLVNKNVLILGYGAIGKKVAHVCKALQMKVNALRRSCQKSYLENEIQIFPPSHLDSLISQTNVLIICLPETMETRGLITDKRLRMLPEESTIVNIGRAAIIDEEALYNNLKERNIYAGLDVWYNYPDTLEELCPPSQFPFHELSNVVMSPHRASRSQEAEYSRMKYVADLLCSYAKGEEMPNKIDINRGY